MYSFLRKSLPLLVAATVAQGADKSAYTLFHPTPTAELRELSTDRPDQTESAHTVDAGHWQIESDLVNYTSDRDQSGGGDVRTKDLSLATLNLNPPELGPVSVRALPKILDSSPLMKLPGLEIAPLVSLTNWIRFWVLVISVPTWPLWARALEIFP